MFKEAIYSSPFDISPSPRVMGCDYNGDRSLLYTLRALVAPRLPEDVVSFNAHFCHGRVDPENFQYDVAYYETSYDNSLWIYDTSKVCFDSCNSRMNCEGFEKVEKVTAFFKNAFDVSCWINEERHRTLVVAVGLDYKKFHFLQCALTVLLPWVFRDNPLSEDEMVLIKSFCNTDVEEYKQAMQKLADGMNLREQFIRSSLRGIEKVAEERRMSEVTAHINDLISDLQSYRDRISNILLQKTQFETELLGLETKLAQTSDEDSEIMEYFIVNKRLTLKNVQRGTLDFVVSDYITPGYFDEDAAEAAINNRHSYVYYYTNINMNHDKVEKLMRAIFLDQVLKVRSCAAYRLTINGSMRAISRYAFGSEGDMRLPNPHIQYHGCIGNYEMIFDQLCEEHNYIGAIEQCIASCKSLNFHDGIVMKEFMNDICRDDYVCIELPDGKVVKPSAAIKWLASQEKEEGNDE